MGIGSGTNWGFLCAKALEEAASEAAQRELAAEEDLEAAKRERAKGAD